MTQTSHKERSPRPDRRKLLRATGMTIAFWLIVLVAVIFLTLRKVFG